MISLNNKGIPQLLQMQDIFVFCPNLNPKDEVPTVLRQLPWLFLNENELLPPIVKIEEIL